MKNWHWLIVVACAFGLGTIANSESNGSAVLLNLEGEFMKAAADHGAHGYMSYYAEDAVEIPNGRAFLNGKAEIAKTMGFLDSSDNHLTWTPVHADVSASGDLGYTYGTFEFRSKDKDGKAVSDTGKYVTIWKKQQDGNWKVALDMGNSGQ
jgi:ketosteroid isomerase-like protein